MKTHWPPGCKKSLIAAFLHLYFFLGVIFTVPACTVYRSPEKKDFESEYPQFKVSSLARQSCSNQSVISAATASKLVYVQQIPPTSSESPAAQLSIWEHLIDGRSVFESNNFQGEYCRYDYQTNHP